MADEPNTDVVDELEHEDGIVEGGEDTTTATTTTDKPDELRKAMAELATTVRTIATPKEKDDEPALTEEQKAELWAVYNPEASRKDFFKKFFRMNPEATPEEVTEA